MPKYPDAIHAFMCGVSAEGRKIVVLLPGSDDSVAVIARSSVIGMSRTKLGLEFRIAMVAGHEVVSYHDEDREMRTLDGRRCFFFVDSRTNPMPLFLEMFAFVFPNAQVVELMQ